MSQFAEGTIERRGPLGEGYERILTPAAVEFVAELARRFGPAIRQALAARELKRRSYQKGRRLDFVEQTADIRDADWKVAPLPKPLTRRVVEITGPVDRKMIINALNSGADCFMADFEDSSAPTWANMVEGQIHLADAVRRTIALDDPARGKSYRLNESTATLLVRPRGLHLEEDGLIVDGRAVPAPLFDFGLYAFHNARELLDRGAGPYFYLPKLEGHLEARIWNEVMTFAEGALDLPAGCMKATVLIETLPAAFEMDEILYELRDHAAGLNCGRWDYIFSYIKVHRWDAARVLPDRGAVGMDQPCMRAYTQLVVKTCHRRGAAAIGGMAAQIPIKNDPEANEAALAKVRADKRREANDGHDGTWVAHPGLVVIAREAFDAVLSGKTNQLDRLREDVHVTAEDLLEVPTGPRTEGGLRHNLRVGVRYLQAWLAGNGCVPIDHLMEDAATAEISRTQISQWLRHRAALDDGQVVDRARVEALLDDEMKQLRAALGDEAWQTGDFDAAARLFARLCFEPELPEFLTTYAFKQLRSKD